MTAGLLACAAVLAGTPGPDPAAMPARVLTSRSGLPNVLAKLRKGGPVRVAYFGGSITAAEGWRVKTFEWLRARYPSARLEQVDATIGGTGSDLAAYRCGQDVLSRKPDLVFVEFAVNDGGAPAERVMRTMEGIVRQVWRALPTTDICFVYTFVVGYEATLDRGVCPPAAGADEVVAERYGIPSINVALRIAQMARQGRLQFAPARGAAGEALPTPPGRLLFSDDGVHPLDAGHAIYAELVTDALGKMEGRGKPGRHAVGKPLYADNWEDATLVPIEPAMLGPGWRRLPDADGLGGAFGRRLPGGIWEATQPGSRLSFRFTGTGAALYDLMGPDAGRAVCTVDGRVGPPVSRFDVFCTYHRLACFAACEGLPAAGHAVTVTVDAEEPDRSAVITAERARPGFDPAHYRGTVLRLGGILLRGRLVR